MNGHESARRYALRYLGLRFRNHSIAAPAVQRTLLFGSDSAADSSAAIVLVLCLPLNLPNPCATAIRSVGLPFPVAPFLPDPDLGRG